MKALADAAGEFPFDFQSLWQTGWQRTTCASTVMSP
jgi:hypothetical protein